jgi:hypothetical protein
MDHGDGIDGRRASLISNSSKAFFYISSGALAISRAQRFLYLERSERSLQPLNAIGQRQYFYDPASRFNTA